MPAEVGSTLELTDVLMVGNGNEVAIGQPLVEGARVVAEVLAHGRDKKIIVFKYKNKTRYRRKQGHRQDFTRLAIRRILTGDEPAEEAKAESPARASRTGRASRARAAAENASVSAEAKPAAASRRRASATKTKAEETPKAAPRRASAPRRTRPKTESEK